MNYHLIARVNKKLVQPNKIVDIKYILCCVHSHNKVGEINYVIQLKIH